MRTVIDGKVYNSETAEELVSVSDYHNGNYCGSRKIMVTGQGRYFLYQSSNGQDLYRGAYIKALAKEEVAAEIDGWRLDEEEQARLIERALIVEA